MKQLDPKYVWQYCIRGVLTPLLLLPLIPVEEFLPGINPYNFAGLLTNYWLILCIAFLVWICIIWVIAKLTYHFYRYELREEGLRKESGIIWKKYHTIPYGRIQNVDIYRGISDRILGLSYLLIQTAGKNNPHFHEGKLPGLSVKTAEQLRDELIQKINKLDLSEEI